MIFWRERQPGLFCKPAMQARLKDSPVQRSILYRLRDAEPAQHGTSLEERRRELASGMRLKHGAERRHRPERSDMLEATPCPGPACSVRSQRIMEALTCKGHDRTASGMTERSGGYGELVAANGGRESRFMPNRSVSNTQYLLSFEMPYRYRQIRWSRWKAQMRSGWRQGSLSCVPLSIELQGPRYPALTVST